MQSRALLLITILSLAPAQAGSHRPPADPAGTSATDAGPPLVGRWDLEIEHPGGSFPSWLEIQRGADGIYSGRFVGRFGAAQPLLELHVEDGDLRFTIPPFTFEGTIDAEGIRGQASDEAGERVTWSAVRAPSLSRREPPKWDESYALISPDGLDGWGPRGNGESGCWSADHGVLSTAGPCTDLVTERKFRDFQLDLEFMLPPGSDSGVHLRGRYEIQLKDDAGNMPEPLTGITGGVYGFLKTLRVPNGKPGEWQTLHVTLVGRTVTVVLNGETVIDAQEIPGITGDALDSDEGLPGPIMLQGHLGSVSYRNIVITPAKSKSVQM